MNRLSVHAHAVGGAALVVGMGTLDLSKASLLRAVLRDAIDAGHDRVVVDLADVPMADAAVVGVLAGQLDHAEAVGVSLSVVGAAGIVLEVLEVLNLSKTLGGGHTMPAPPPRPTLVCCTPPGPAAEPVAPDPRALGASWVIPNETIGALLAAMATLDPDDPVRCGLHDQVIELALPAAYHMAARYHGRGESEDDLRQVAAVGLLKAVEGYDPHRGHLFSDYAVPTILGELRRHFRDRGWAVHVPRRTKELVLDARRVTDQLTQELNRAPNVGDLAGALGVDASVVANAMAAAGGYRPQSLSWPVDGSSLELTDLIGLLDPRYEYLENWQSIATVLRELPERTRRILVLRFCEDMSQVEIAADVGVSQVHVSRIISQALATLRAVLFAED